jgi:biopolymer transport protein ExbD
MGAKLAGGGKGKGMSPNSEPNVIPFIDIMLVMLIIFMVAAPPPTVDIKVDLPPPNSQNLPPNPNDDKPTFVFLEEHSGTLVYKIGGEEVPLANFKDKLVEKARENNPNKAGDDVKLFLDGKIFVKADQQTAYNNVVGLMNQIDGAGFKSVSLVAEDAQF